MQGDRLKPRYRAHHVDPAHGFRRTSCATVDALLRLVEAYVGNFGREQQKRTHRVALHRPPASPAIDFLLIPRATLSVPAVVGGNLSRPCVRQLFR